MRILAIGDIHGCLRALDTLLGLVRPQADDQIITLGDYVDRGPDSCGVLDRLLALRREHRLVALRGNHDVMMTQARLGIDRRMWLACGGKVTLASYGVAVPETCDLSPIPEEHWRFLEDELVDGYETRTHIFVHGNLYPDVPLEEQPEYMLHWEKLVEPVAHCSGKVVVCGHTKQHDGEPLDWETVVCIDTGVYEPYGWLTCLDVLEGRYWQANERGQARTGRLGGGPPRPAGGD
jgi:serine/threonine protein phosphatase 1